MDALPSGRSLVSQGAVPTMNKTARIDQDVPVVLPFQEANVSPIGSISTSPQEDS